MKDKNFRYLSADDLGDALRQAGLVADVPTALVDRSDEAIVIADAGVFGACLVLDSQSRTPTQVAVWATQGAVPAPAMQLLAASEYAGGIDVVDVGASSVQPPDPTKLRQDSVLLASVVGSSSDFEYQLPASPKYFVGRSKLLADLQKVLTNETGNVVVLNAQSGWGKSSLALKFKDLAERQKGVALVLDTRTADSPRYLVEVLRRLATKAEAEGILRLSANPSWASLDSAIATLRAATWLDNKRPLIAFFDQFENVFRNVELTRAFRDLALSSREIAGPLVIGFAWKTDLVGWTEGHPYQLRDDIRGVGPVLIVEPFGPDEVTVLLRRLEKQAGEQLLPDLRSRLRAYSQGLPWLLKKLADHVLKELHHGSTQEQLLAESLNVVGLFEADLAELNPQQHEVVRHVARFAPIPATEVTERYGPDTVQSLVDRRLLVQVGDRLDTYWDTFRDFLNTGSVPVQDSYILRQTPRSVARVLPLVVEAGGSATVQDLARSLDTSDNAIRNLSRELRLLGVTTHEPNRVVLVDEVLSADDRELEMRRRVASALRRHRAYSTLRKLAERGGGVVSLASYAREMPNAFPAVDVAESAWLAYARAFLFWSEYAGLAARTGSDYRPTPDAVGATSLRLLDPPSPVKARPGVPQLSPRRAVSILNRLHAEGEIDLPTQTKDREATGALVAMGAVIVTPLRKVRPLAGDLYNSDGSICAGTIRRLLASVPGGQAGLTLVEADPAAHPRDVGAAISAASGAHWKEDTSAHVGGYFRSWAGLAGLTVHRASRRTSTTRGEAQP
ncbi:MAG: hypothetical protein QOI54_1866 [Actinomycetota bacterium]|nr:hypothetical protein [Actinomycetota bacterium]